MTIKTNYRPRDIIHFWDLTEKEQKEFDYLDTEDRQNDAQFVRYRNWVYDLSDFEGSTRGLGAPKEFAGWDQYQSDSFFSGILIRYVNDFEQVVCATYYS